jgi:hypothetical protein
MAFLLNGILGIFLALIIFVFIWYPVATPIIDDFIATLDPSNEGDNMIGIVIQMMSFIVLLAIVLSIIQYINPGEPADGRF